MSPRLVFTLARPASHTPGPAGSLHECVAQLQNWLPEFMTDSSEKRLGFGKGCGNHRCTHHQGRAIDAINSLSHCA